MDITSGLVAHSDRTVDRVWPWPVAVTLVALMALLVIALAGGLLPPVADPLMAAPYRW